MSKFGRIWVNTSGSLPEITIAEPDLIKEILVKNFDSFTNRVEFGVEDQVCHIFFKEST